MKREREELADRQALQNFKVTGEVSNTRTYIRMMSMLSFLFTSSQLSPS